MLAMFKTPIQLSALALVAAMVTGCVSTQQLEEVRQLAQQAQQTADQANSTANRSLQTAEDARAMSIATEEKFNRMFRQSMLK